MPIGLFVLIIIAIIFPKFTRFVFTLVFFGFVFMAASCIDHQAKAADDVSLYRNHVALSNCLAGMAETHKPEIHQIQKLQGDPTIWIVGSCNVLLGSYIHYCEPVSSEDACYGNVRDMAIKAVDDVTY